MFHCEICSTLVIKQYNLVTETVQYNQTILKDTLFKLKTFYDFPQETLCIGQFSSYIFSFYQTISRILYFMVLCVSIITFLSFHLIILKYQENIFFYILDCVSKIFFFYILFPCVNIFDIDFTKLLCVKLFDIHFCII